MWFNMYPRLDGIWMLGRCYAREPKKTWITYLFLLSFPINSLLQGSLFVNCQMSLAVQYCSHILHTIWNSRPFLSLLNSTTFFFFSKPISNPFSFIMPFWSTGINRVYSLLILTELTIPISVLKIVLIFKGFLLLLVLKLAYIVTLFDFFIWSCLFYLYNKC